MDSSQVSSLASTVLRLLLLLTPILLIQFGLAIYGLIDLSKRKVVRGPRGLWLALLILSIVSFPAGVIVAGLYLLWGRHPEGQLGVDDDSD